jgi:hypothetical protein
MATGKKRLELRRGSFFHREAVTIPRGYRVARASAPNGRKGYVGVTPYGTFVIQGDKLRPVYESGNIGTVFDEADSAALYCVAHAAVMRATR